MNMDKRVFIYVRVSTQEQVNGYSISEQIDRLRKYAAAHGWIVVNEYSDNGYSGGNTDRPALKCMIADIRAGKGDSVLVYKLDRLSRSQKDTLELIEDIFLANNCDFVSMNENFDTATPFGRAMIGILAVFAQLEREQIKERLIMGRTGRAKEGFFHGGRFTPIGYDYKDGKLDINEYEALQVKEFFELYLSGKTFKAIERDFIAKGYKHKYGNWNAATMKKTLQNTVYIGQIKFNGRSYSGQHEPIIDIETFSASNKLYADRSDAYKRYNRPSGHSTLLGGLLRCGKCGAKYGIAKYHADQSYYSCYSRRKQNRNMIKDDNCKNKNYRMSELDNIVLNEIRKLAIDPDYISTIAPPVSEDKSKILRMEIDRLDEQKSRLMSLFGTGAFEIDEILAKVEPINEQKQKLTNELNAIESGRTAPDQELIKIVSGLNDILDRNNFDEIRLVIDSLIDEIVINDDEIEIKWRFA